MARTASINRKTGETKVEISVCLDGNGSGLRSSGIGFLDHMLDLFAKHALIDLELEAVGDLHVDDHHTCEDIGIVLGQAIHQSLGDRSGVRRYGHFTLPMDECLVTAAVDMGGRYAFEYQAPIAAEKIGEFDSELIEQARHQLHGDLKKMQADISHLMTAALEEPNPSQSKNKEEDVIIAGERNLLNVDELATNVITLRKLFDVFEQRSSLMQLLDNSQKAEGVQIFIGGESGYSPLDECSMVTSPYQVDGQVVGTRAGVRAIIPEIPVDTVNNE